MSRTDDLQRFTELARKFATGMLVTVSTEGALSARPMAVARVDDDGSIWFVTSRDSSAVDEVLSYDRAAVELQAATLHMHVYGRAKVYLDKEHRRALWSEMMRPWFPDGPETAELCAVRVQPTSADWWDLRGSNALRFAFEAAKAVVKGETIPADAQGEHVHADL